LSRVDLHFDLFYDRNRHASVYYNEVLTGYAYNTVPNASITAGEGFRTPEPGTLGLLALGSLGLGFWRRRAGSATKDTAA
jgi:hypothetical protein